MQAILHQKNLRANKQKYKDRLQVLNCESTALYSFYQSGYFIFLPEHILFLLEDYK